MRLSHLRSRRLAPRFTPTTQIPARRQPRRLLRQICLTPSGRRLVTTSKSQASTRASAAVLAHMVPRSRALRKRLGYRPNVSLGAAAFLAAADLVDRLGHADFILLGCGDTNIKPPDQSFTGDDTFSVVFRTSGATRLRGSS